VAAAQRALSFQGIRGIRRETQLSMTLTGTDPRNLQLNAIVVP
jgi:hypothetical protein